MPLYDYHCTACHADFELLVRSSTVPACPICAAEDLEKAVSRIAPHARIPALRKAWRAKADREGAMSHYSTAEKAQMLK